MSLREGGGLQGSLPACKKLPVRSAGEAIQKGEERCLKRSTSGTSDQPLSSTSS